MCGWGGRGLCRQAREKQVLPCQSHGGNLSGSLAALSEEAGSRGPGSSSSSATTHSVSPLVPRGLQLDVEKRSHEGGCGVRMGKVGELCSWRPTPHGPRPTPVLAFLGPCRACACVLGDAGTLTRGCLRFLPGRPTFRAVVLGSCRSSLPRASSCSSPSCGHRHSL